MSIDEDVSTFCCGDGFVCEEDLKWDSRKEYIEKFQHTYNPAHLYCRLKECGLDDENVKALCKVYDYEVYQVIIANFRERV